MKAQANELDDYRIRAREWLAKNLEHRSAPTGHPSIGRRPRSKSPRPGSSRAISSTPATQASPYPRSTVAGVLLRPRACLQTGGGRLSHPELRGHR